MQQFAGGAAFVDGSGAVLAADGGFLALLGLDPADATGALRARAESQAELKALLAGEREQPVRLSQGECPVEVERVPCGAGSLLVVRDAGVQERLEHAMRSHGLTRVAAGVAHDIKNPLNAMSLQIALLVDKLSASDEARITSSAHLGALRDQIGRVNEVVRRFLDVADPSAPLGYIDVGALLIDVATLFGHDARRRRIEISVDATPGAARTPCDAARIGRLIVGLYARALAETPDGGKLAVRAAGRDAVTEIALEHGVGDPDPDLGYYTGTATAAAEALGGALTLQRHDGTERISLTLPRNDRA